MDDQSSFSNNGVLRVQDGGALDNGPAVWKYDNGVPGMYLNGSTYMEFPDSASLDISNNITIEVFAKATDTNINYILQKLGAYGFPNLLGEVLIRSSIWRDSLTKYEGEVLTTYKDKMLYFASTYNSATRENVIYINGVKVGLSTTLAPPNKISTSNNKLLIGKTEGITASGKNFVGEVFSVRVSNIVRTCIEIQINECRGTS